MHLIALIQLELEVNAVFLTPHEGRAGSAPACRRYQGSLPTGAQGEAMLVGWRQREQAPALHTLARGPIARGFRPHEAYGVRPARPACRRYQTLSQVRQ